MERPEVYKLIDGEREYQELRWNKDTTISEGVHSVEEWFLYIEDYINEAKHILTRNARQKSDQPAMEIMRKVAAMAVCAMEQHETKPRFIPEGMRK